MSKRVNNKVLNLGVKKKALEGFRDKSEALLPDKDSFIAMEYLVYDADPHDIAYNCGVSEDDVYKCASEFYEAYLFYKSTGLVLTKASRKILTKTKGIYDLSIFSEESLAKNNGVINGVEITPEFVSELAYNFISSRLHHFLNTEIHVQD